MSVEQPSLAFDWRERDRKTGQKRASARDEPEFLHIDTSWNFILVASEFEPEIESRIYQKDRPHGLFLNGDNFQFWIKTWAEVVRENEARLQFVQKKLQLKVSDSEIESGSRSSSSSSCADLDIAPCPAQSRCQRASPRTYLSSDVHPFHAST